MRRTMCCGFLPLCGLTLLVLFADPTARTTQAKRRVNCEGQNMVCPVFSWGFFMGFYHYMALDCATGTTVGLSSTGPLPLCSCAAADCETKCIDYGSYAAAKEKPEKEAKDEKATKRKPGKPLGNSSQFTEDTMEVGIEPRDSILAPETFIKPGAGIKSATQLDRKVVRLYLDRDGKRPIKVALHTVKVVPVDNVTYSTRDYRIGYEVKNGMEEDTIRWEKIRKERNGKVLLVDYDGNDYMVVIGKENADPDEKKTAAAMPKGR